eukprot:CCRYP_013186-RA/>CCRYP_013186-RA protein AED:0.00 eAED:0.00 QI:89/1/1/1/0/0/2/37/33
MDTLLLIPLLYCSVELISKYNQELVQKGCVSTM